MLSLMERNGGVQISVMKPMATVDVARICWNLFTETSSTVRQYRANVEWESQVAGAPCLAAKTVRPRIEPMNEGSAEAGRRRGESCPT